MTDKKTIIKASILGTGSYVPDKILSNQDLEGIIDTNDEWIVTRTGIKERRVAADEQATSDLAYEAAVKALADAGIEAKDLDLIIVGTITPDMPFPATACVLQQRLGVSMIPAFDLTAACSGFLYGLDVACSMITAGNYEKVLVIGAETLTRITDYQDRGSCILFGDGAGAVVVGKSEEGKPAIEDSVMTADGTNWEPLQLPGGGSRNPATPDTIEKRMHYMQIAGRAVYKLAVTKIVEIVKDILDRNNLKPEDIALYIPHQMNERIMEGAAGRLGIEMDVVYRNIAKYGNTSAASIPIALDEAIKDGSIKKGDNVVLVSFGGGLTWAATLVQW
ncbi:MAG: beta-ketoacyl-ACP synthase III [Planctomycetota bacterium]|jgi:3-oxoacyl-[acyl-carrier-protein] synthase-3